MEISSLLADIRTLLGNINEAIKNQSSSACYSSKPPKQRLWTLRNRLINQAEADLDRLTNERILNGSQQHTILLLLKRHAYVDWKSYILYQLHIVRIFILCNLIGSGIPTPNDFKGIYTLEKEKKKRCIMRSERKFVVEKDINLYIFLISPFGMEESMVPWWMRDFSIQ